MTSTTRQAIERDWKISRVITEHPELIDELIAISPAFSNLRNPVLRRIKSRLVTVEQAARIAEIDPDALVHRLNQAVGISTESIPDSTVEMRDTSPGDEPPEWAHEAEVAAELDVRPFQRRGEEPFSAIMEAVREVPVGSAFRLRNSFEPVPLYDILGKRGFEPWARQLGPDDWEILFYNSGRRTSPAKDQTPSPQANAGEDSPAWYAPTASITIDVSELVPPEPMIRILEALEDLAPGESLLVHHVRRPMHLYPRLDELGYRHQTHEDEPGRVLVLIEKPSRTDGAVI